MFKLTLKLCIWDIETFFCAMSSGARSFLTQIHIYTSTHMLEGKTTIRAQCKTGGRANKLNERTTELAITSDFTFTLSAFLKSF